MAAEEKAALNDALSTANSAVSGSDGDAMMAAYRTLAQANTAAVASANEYDKINLAYTEQLIMNIRKQLPLRQ